MLLLLVLLLSVYAVLQSGVGGKRLDSPHSDAAAMSWHFPVCFPGDDFHSTDTQTMSTREQVV